MKYILIQEEGNGNQIRHEFTEEGLQEVISRILYFLRGSSFVIDAHAELELIRHPEKFGLGLEASMPRRKQRKQK